MNIFKSWLRKAGNAYINALCKREFTSQVFDGHNERPVEYRYVFEQITRHCPRHVLDVGTGKSALPQLIRNCGCLVTAIDNVHDYWPKGMANRHYYVMQDDILRTKLKHAEYDLITCISVLEHIQDHRQAVRSMIDLLKPGGRLVLSFPYNEHRYVSNVYALPGSIGADKFSFATQVYSRVELTQWCNDSPVCLIEQEYWRFFEGEFWTLGDPICPPEQTGPDHSHHIACILLQKEPLR